MAEWFTNHLPVVGWVTMWLALGGLTARLFGKLCRAEERLAECERLEVARNSGEHDGV